MRIVCQTRQTAQPLPHGCMGISWRDEAAETEVLSRAGLPCAHMRLARAQAGGGLMPPTCQTSAYPSGIFFFWKTLRWRGEETSQRHLKASLKLLHTDTTPWEALARKHPSRHGLIHKGCQTYGVNHTAEARVSCPELAIKQLGRLHILPLPNMCQDRGLWPGAAPQPTWNRAMEVMSMYAQSCICERHTQTQPSLLPRPLLPFPPVC